MEMTGSDVTSVTRESSEGSLLSSRVRRVRRGQACLPLFFAARVPYYPPDQRIYSAVLNSFQINLILMTQDFLVHMSTASQIRVHLQNYQ